jgi:arginine decarboxylase
MEETNMEIHVASGVASGPTELAAFDASLYAAGIANFNLLQLSSVIPPNSKVIEHDDRIPSVEGEWGDRLYVVKADYRTTIPGTEAWAGIGWVIDDATGKGLFVEHEGENKEQVEWQIENSLKSLMAIRNIDLGEMHMKVDGILCEHDPVGAIVIAVFKSEPW